MLPHSAKPVNRKLKAKFVRRIVLSCLKIYKVYLPPIPHLGAFCPILPARLACYLVGVRVRIVSLHPDHANSGEYSSHPGAIIADGGVP